MKRFVRKGLRFSALLLVSVCILFALFLGYLTLTRYRPGIQENAIVAGIASSESLHSSTIRLLTWNIGYCGLGKEMDFFYEGGSMVRPDQSLYKRYVEGVERTLSEMGRPDFIFLQEVDQNSKRSYYFDQVASISARYPNYESEFAVNYNAKFVPIPITGPMGKVKGGILTLSRYKTAETKRYSYPSSYKWPKQLFMLNRCLLLSRINLSGGKQLVLINIHNSAFDDAAEMRKQEIAFLKRIMVEEYSKGHYVIVGGDWNMNPLPYDSTAFSDGNKGKSIHPGIPESFLPSGWRWVYDPQHATNRDVNTPYLKGKSLTTIIDFFVLSPNVKLRSVRAQETGFAYSDHQPVLMDVELDSITQL